MYAAFRRFWSSGDHDVDIIGFSRGAALSREFANVLDKTGYSTMVPFGNGYRLKRHCSVEVRYLGLFDTVASFGRPGNDVNFGYRLDIPPNVRKVAHAVAQDEKRSLFPVTLLNDPLPNQDFSEFVFPGDHSDIGGGHGEWVETHEEVPGFLGFKRKKLVSREFKHDRRLVSIAPLVYIWLEGIRVGVPFGPLPEREYINSYVPHDLSTTPSMLLGARLFGNHFDANFPVQPRGLESGRLR